MTIDKSKEVTIPVWLISVILSLLITGFTTFGIISAKNATTEVRLEHVERDVASKVSKDEFVMVMDRLKAIEHKLDKLTQQ
jgi:hypothetical protein